MYQLQTTRVTRLRLLHYKCGRSFTKEADRFHAVPFHPARIQPRPLVLALCGGSHYRQRKLNELVTVQIVRGAFSALVIVQNFIHLYGPAKATACVTLLKTLFPCAVLFFAQLCGECALFTLPIQLRDWATYQWKAMSARDKKISGLLKESSPPYIPHQ